MRDTAVSLLRELLDGYPYDVGQQMKTRIRRVLADQAQTDAVLTKTLSKEQRAALRLYASTHGRTWKAALLSDWAGGRDEGYLRQVRNIFGPSWLLTHGEAAIKGDQ